LLIGLGYGVYEIIQGAAPVHKDPAAFSNSHDVARLESHLHIDIERSINHFTNAHTVLAYLAGYYYDSMHYVITPLVLGWLWWQRPAVYARWRSALVTASMGALVVFWLWPVAPPRMALHGIVDTLVSRHILGTVAKSGSTGGLVNQYAAMPSLHVGWAFWCAAAVVGTTKTRWHHLAWLYPVATTVVVLATGNHYLLDGVGGIAFITLGFAVTTMAPQQIATPRLPRFAPKRASGVDRIAPVRQPDRGPSPEHDDADWNLGQENKKPV
jgi:hypothetical protein